MSNITSWGSRIVDNVLAKCQEEVLPKRGWHLRSPLGIIRLGPPTGIIPRTVSCCSGELDQQHRSTETKLRRCHVDVGSLLVDILSCSFSPSLCQLCGGLVLECVEIPKFRAVQSFFLSSSLGREDMDLR
ncbi:hypothetical protein Mapa_005667 [Marchantia paleacea]|nr:hypothetical protein Mapa_005667 [Marchantia paleacea]